MDKEILKSNERKMPTTVVSTRVPVQVKGRLTILAGELGYNVNQYVALLVVRSTEMGFDPMKYKNQINELSALKKKLALAEKKLTIEGKTTKATATKQTAQINKQITEIKRLKDDLRKSQASIKASEKKLSQAEKTAVMSISKTTGEHGKLIEKVARIERNLEQAKKSNKDLTTRLNKANDWREKHNSGIRKGTFSGDPICPSPKPEKF